MLFLVAFAALIILYIYFYKIVISIFRPSQRSKSSPIYFLFFFIPFILLIIIFQIYKPDLPVSFRWSIPESSNIFLSNKEFLFNLSYIKVFFILILILAAEGLLFMKIKKIPFRQIFMLPYMKIISLFVLTLLIISIINTFPAMVKYYSAEDLVKGYSDHFEINLSLKEKNNSLNNKTFILVMQSNGNYYLIEKSGSLQESVPQNLIIIPETQIQTAAVKRVNFNRSAYFWK